MGGRKQRDAEFSAFVSSAAPTLTKTAWFLTGNADTAADLVQEAFVRTYLAWRRIRPETAVAYARRVLVNLNADRWRRRRPETPAADVDAVRPSHEATVDDRDRIVRMLATLPPRQREVLVLRYFDDLSESAVADLLGVSVGSVKSAASRGLAALRTHYAMEDLS
jgi:RNA polymerase sigma-70 factor (sigma-E family)